MTAMSSKDDKIMNVATRGFNQAEIGSVMRKGLGGRMGWIVAAAFIDIKSLTASVVAAFAGSEGLSTIRNHPRSHARRDRRSRLPYRHITPAAAESCKSCLGVGQSYASAVTEAY
jgi:hypothetical protein